MTSTKYLDFRYDVASAVFVDRYDELPLWSAPFGSLLLEELPLIPCARVLDVGCGTGFPLLTLAGRLGPSAHITGIDPWAAGVERARAKAHAADLANVDVLVGDASNLPFTDASFDLVVCNLGLNNFDAPAVVARECARVLRVGGHFALTTNLVGHMRELYAIFRKTLADIDRAELVPAVDREEARRGTIASVTELLTRTGLELAKCVEAKFALRFADGTALLNDDFVKIAFLPAWKALVACNGEPAREFFAAFETNLNQASRPTRALRLTIPMAYIEFVKR